LKKKDNDFKIFEHKSFSTRKPPISNKLRNKKKLFIL